MPDNIVYVGRKPIMAYVTACLTCISRRDGEGDVIVVARGNSISRAVDAIEVLKRFLAYEIEGVEFGTDVIDQDGGQRNISTIRISLRKKNP